MEEFGSLSQASIPEPRGRCFSLGIELNARESGAPGGTRTPDPLLRRQETHSA